MLESEIVYIYIYIYVCVCVCVCVSHYVNILGGIIHTLKENAEALVGATREIGLEVSADKTKYTVMSRDQNA